MDDDERKMKRTRLILSLVAMEAEIKGQILEMIDEVSLAFKQMQSLLEEVIKIK